MTEKQTRDSTDQETAIKERQIVLDLVRRQYASVAWTHKTHEKQAEIYARKYKNIETLNIIFAAVTTCGIGTTIFVNELWAKIIVMVCSFVTVAATAYHNSFDIKGRLAVSKAAANQFVIVRNDLLQIIADLHRNRKSLESIEDQYTAVMQKLGELYADAPPITQEAVDMADEELNKKTSLELDRKIDGLLPSSLRGQIHSDKNKG